MFHASVYSSRRAQLKKIMGSGILLFPGNMEASYNYPANTYHFRQDSNFLYYFGMDHPDLFGVIDVDSGKDYIFGNDVDLDDIIWMGPQPLMKDRAENVGIKHTAPLTDLKTFLQTAVTQKRSIHYVPTYRGTTVLQLMKLLAYSEEQVRNGVSTELVKAVIRMREIKDEHEIAEIEKAVDIAYDMHTTAMRMAKPGVVEREIAGTMEGISLSQGGPVSFPIILTINGQTLHNHYHGNTLREGRMMIADAGAETTMHYSSDITRTTPVGGKFSQRQKEIYEIVLKANMETIAATRPGISNKELHLMAARIIAEGMKDLGFMKGDMEDAVMQGAHAMFFPHGLGHPMGLDVHDMEGLGENYVGYDESIQRSDQFGLAFLRMGKVHQPGFVFTIEPGIYFIPELIDQWKAEKKFEAFLNYDKIESYKDFGGIRIEDDVLVTKQGYKVLGKPIPKTVTEVEMICAG